MPVFKLTVHKTYFYQGFFNVPAAFDGYVRREEGPVILCLGGEGRRIEGRIDRRANKNGTARVLGSTGLRDWFRANFNVMDQVDVEIGSPGEIRLQKCR